MKRVISHAAAVMVVGIILPVMGQTAAHADEKAGPQWMVFAHPSDPGGASPWIIKGHKCNDGESPGFISSSAREKLTGVLRSRPFAAPENLSFWLCGHRGHRGLAAIHENSFVRLVDAKTGKELYRVYPPGADVAQRFAWNLSGIKNTSVHLEVVDGDNNPSGRGYAWLAVGRFAPEVVKVASFKPVEGSAELDVAKVPYANPVATRPEPKATTDKPTKPVVAKASEPAAPKANEPVAAPTQPQVIISGGPKRGIFPEEGAGIHVHGDLVISDPVNRRGALREKRHIPRHYFAMLPYGMVWYHGAPADIRDLPPGIHMHGRFLLPMEGEEETIPLTEKLLKNHENHRYNHAILLEDDVSFYSRQGRSWKVLGFEQGGGPAPRLKLSVEPVGPEIEGGINKAALFDIDDSTRVWKNRQLVNKDQIKEGMDVQVNLTWGPFDSLATTDVWLDESSLQANREIQRQRHLRMIRSRFLPGWVDEVKNNDAGGGEVTVTFFGGMDQELYDDIRKSQNLKICNAETTLRSWNYHQEHASPATILEKREIKHPPLGSSGLQVRMKVTQMLDGFRPGWVVRVKGPWTYVLLPWDEHINSAEAYEKSKKMTLP